MKLTLRNWGLLPYGQGLARMTELQQMRIKQQVGDSLILLEHPPTVTLGRKGGTVLMPEDKLRQMGVDLFTVERAGQATVHSPGQAIIYPIIDIKAAKIPPRSLVADLMYAIVDTAMAFGVKARADLEDHVGVWVDERKLAAVGLQITQGVTMHGLAFNVSNDLALFDFINACGAGLPATSLEQERGETVRFKDVQLLCAHNIEKRLNERLALQQHTEARPALEKTG